MGEGIIDQTVLSRVGYVPTPPENLVFRDGTSSKVGVGTLSGAGSVGVVSPLAWLGSAARLRGSWRGYGS